MYGKARWPGCPASSMSRRRRTPAGGAARSPGLQIVAQRPANADWRRVRGSGRPSQFQFPATIRAEGEAAIHSPRAGSGSSRSWSDQLPLPGAIRRGGAAPFLPVGQASYRSPLSPECTDRRDARLPSSFHVQAPEGRPREGRLAFQAPDHRPAPRERRSARGAGERAAVAVPIPGNGTGGC
jgi:hypothetical protein